MKTYSPSQSFIRTATATPVVAIGNIPVNIKNIVSLYEQASERNVSLVVFPELCVTGYTLGDLLLSTKIINDSRRALSTLASATANSQTAMIVGLPLLVGSALYNCAALLAGGKIQGIVPKTNLPNYREFYEKRWFQPWNKPTITITLDDQEVPFGNDLVFSVAGSLIGIEICEDAWVTNQPSRNLINKGAQIICNPSASPEMVTKSAYRKQLVGQTSASQVGGYIYAGADPSESTMDIVMGGHALIYQMGRQLAERKPFSTDENRLLVADIDIDLIENERVHDNNFITDTTRTLINVGLSRTQTDLITHLDPTPFIPKGSDSDIAGRLDEILTIQAFGLKKRLESSGAKRVVLGLSGGLDSTLALMVALKTASIRSVQPGDMILTVTMPGDASSKRTQSNAEKLAEAVGVENQMIPINDLSNAQLTALGRDLELQDTTYENTQARIRTALLFNKANGCDGIVLGTGDLSEIALGWCTFNGDHMSAYNVNASIPKSLVKYLVRHSANTLVSKTAREILLDILDTPISPELTKSKGKDLSQKTEDLVGPYELHDFFLYHFVRWLETPEKILYLATKAFDGKYASDVVEHWLNEFLRRFLGNQWKRSVMPDGPKVGSVSLSPRGDWRMPSDIDRNTFSDVQ
jgi:NAD+ synthase (glutamine-hydrolysing)